MTLTVIRIEPSFCVRYHLKYKISNFTPARCECDLYNITENQHLCVDEVFLFCLVVVISRERYTSLEITVKCVYSILAGAINTEASCGFLA